MHHPATKFYTSKQTRLKQQLLAFSLAELMTIVGILSILSLIAIPSYRTYVNTTKVGAAMTILDKFETSAQILFDSGDLNTSMTFNDVTLTTNVPAAVDAPPVVQAMFIGPSQNANVPSNAFVVCVFIAQLNFTDYIEPTSADTGSGSRLCKQVTYSNNLITSRCGSLDGSGSINLPVEYMPEGCKCANIWGAC